MKTDKHIHKRSSKAVVVLNTIFPFKYLQYLFRKFLKNNYVNSFINFKSIWILQIDICFTTKGLIVMHAYEHTMTT